MIDRLTVTPGQIWTARYQTGVKVHVLEADGRHVDFEFISQPGVTRRLSRPKFLTTYQPPKEKP